ncbi:hypothetical protein [Bartonella australis]|uniref:hypothetical protein n=1 Tax=Bartonella australis TaxID=388640 RepID=UPI00034C4209|nr:hypothetical protein [Bartonella australis]
MKQQAQQAGVGEIVTSALEAEDLREVIGGDTALVTLGTRPNISGKGDQKRITTPRKALDAGENHLRHSTADYSSG